MLTLSSPKVSDPKNNLVMQYSQWMWQSFQSTRAPPELQKTQIFEPGRSLKCEDDIIWYRFVLSFSPHTISKLCVICSSLLYSLYEWTPPNISLSSTDNRTWLCFVLSYSPQSPSCVLPVLPCRVVFRSHLRLHPSRPQQIHQSWRPSEGPVWSDIHSLHHVLHLGGDRSDGKVWFYFTTSSIRLGKGLNCGRSRCHGFDTIALVLCLRS